MSDPDKDGRSFCTQNDEQCIRCQHRACNSHQLEFEKPLSCIKCIPSETENCAIIDKNVTAIACDRTTIGYKNSCYTYQTGQYVARGCLYEANGPIFDICNKNNTSLCSMCEQSDCNREPAKNITFSPLILHDFIFKHKMTYDELIPLRGEENRLHCYQCDGTDECTFMNKTNVMKPKPCPIASKYDQCYTFIQQKGWSFFISFNF